MFKRYDQKQQFLLPLNLEEFVSEDHISRVLNDLIDVVDISAIESTYSENGCPAYHPRLFLKILFYGYLINIRSSRKIDDKKYRLEKIKAAKKKMDEEKLKKVNITDTDAKIMKHKDGSKKPSYNCQVAVDEKEQIIVAADLVCL